MIAAIKKNDTQMALTLLAEGADANARDEPPQHMSLWRLLLDRLRGRYSAPSTTHTALWLACAWGEEDLRRKPAPDNWPLVKVLLERGAKVNVTDKRGETPILLAVRLDKQQVCHLLIQRGANVNAADIHDWTPLKWAVLMHSTDMVRLLVDNGAHVNTVCSSRIPGDMTPLMLAQGIGQDDPTITEILLTKGAGVNATTPYGRSALHIAIDDNRVRSVRTLIGHGANVNLATSYGVTPLKMAKRLGRSMILQMLKQAGAKE
ncbi:MAG TPA: ankyrin repeat domain-containing protein [Chthonomonadaceae bacterium]|nr:ankyrin repeat domain-containing protein [Chthonomonadaceae bacterium]